MAKIEIQTNSNLQIIGSYAFECALIEEIYFTANLKELNEGWCHEVDNLKKIIISPSNDQFIFKNDKYLLGKSDSNNDKFDTLLFVRSDIEEFFIPSNIKVITSCAFNRCFNLKKVEIPTKSNLQTIESFVFSISNIKSIFIPSKVSRISEHAFFNLK